MLLLVELIQLQLLMILEILNFPKAVLQVKWLCSFLSTQAFPHVLAVTSVWIHALKYKYFGEFAFFFFSPSKRLKQAVSRPSGLFLSNASADLEKWQKWDASFQSLPTIAAKTFLQIELIASSSQSYTVLLTYLLFLRLSQFRTLKELLLKSFSNLSQYFQTEHCLLAF